MHPFIHSCLPMNSSSHPFIHSSMSIHSHPFIHIKMIRVANTPCHRHMGLRSGPTNGASARSSALGTGIASGSFKVIWRKHKGRSLGCKSNKYEKMQLIESKVLEFFFMFFSSTQTTNLLAANRSWPHRFRRWRLGFGSSFGASTSCRWELNSSHSQLQEPPPKHSEMTQILSSQLLFRLTLATRNVGSLCCLLLSNTSSVKQQKEWFEKTQRGTDPSSPPYEKTALFLCGKERNWSTMRSVARASTTSVTSGFSSTSTSSFSWKRNVCCMPHMPVSFIGITTKTALHLLWKSKCSRDLQKSSLMIQYLAKMPKVHGAINSAYQCFLCHATSEAGQHKLCLASPFQ